MRPAALAAILLAAGCGAPAPSPSPAGGDPVGEHADFILQMKALDVQLENLQHDLAARKGSDAARARVAKMKRSAEEAARLPYRPVQAENRDLAYRFSLFAARLDALGRESWDGEDGIRLWKDLGRSCLECHEMYRVD